jgi:protein subunit release factor A
MATRITLKPEDLSVTVELVPRGFGSPSRVVKIEHTPTGLTARSGIHRSDHANKEVAWKALQKKVRAHYKNPPAKRFSYAIGHYWNTKEKDSIGTYAYHTEVHSGTMEEAENFLKYVKEQSPDNDWKIFMLVEVPK